MYQQRNDIEGSVYMFEHRKFNDNADTLADCGQSNCDANLQMGGHLPHRLIPTVTGDQVIQKFCNPSLDIAFLQMKKPPPTQIAAANLSKTIKLGNEFSELWIQKTG